MYDISFRRRRKAKRGGRREAAAGRRGANKDAEEGKGKEGSERGVRQKERGEAERAQAKLLSLLPVLLYTQICMTSPSCGGGRVRGRRTGRRRDLRPGGREAERICAIDKEKIKCCGINVKCCGINEKCCGINEKCCGISEKCCGINGKCCGINEKC